MKIILLSGKGDELLLDTEVVEEAEKILREYRSKGCFVSTGTDEITALKEPLPSEVIIVYPMAGGRVEDGRFKKGFIYNITLNIILIVPYIMG